MTMIDHYDAAKEDAAGPSDVPFYYPAVTNDDEHPIAMIGHLPYSGQHVKKTYTLHGAHDLAIDLLTAERDGRPYILVLPHTESHRFEFTIADGGPCLALARKIANLLSEVTGA